jgi:hypothetical protein
VAGTGPTSGLIQFSRCRSGLFAAASLARQCLSKTLPRSVNILGGVQSAGHDTLTFPHPDNRPCGTFYSAIDLPVTKACGLSRRFPSCCSRTFRRNRTLASSALPWLVFATSRLTLGLRSCFQPAADDAAAEYHRSGQDVDQDKVLLHGYLTVGLARFASHSASNPR